MPVAAPREYDELRIRYWAVGHDEYYVLANGPACAAALINVAGVRDFQADLNSLLAEQFRQVAPAPDAESVDSRLQKIGNDLCKALLPPAILECYRQSLRKSLDGRRSLRIRFCLPPELAGYPIELLRQEAGFLALDKDVSIVRSPATDGANPLRQREAKEPLTVILASASPRGYAELNIIQEIKEIRSALAYQLRSKRIELRPVPRATRQSLEAELDSATTECAVILIAHGEYDEHTGKGFVVLEASNGDPDRVDDELFSGYLRAKEGVPFVALNLCKGAMTNPYDPFSGLAARLIGKGVPMVIAFQFQVSDQSARQFSRAVLSAITRRCSVDEACTSGRFMGQTKETTIEWCTPMLHLHKDCVQTQLLPAPNVDSPLPPMDTLEHALWTLRTSRLKDPWDEILNLAKDRAEQYAELAPLHREAWVEVNLVGECRKIADALIEGEPPQIGGHWPFDEPDPLQSFRDLVARREREKTIASLTSLYNKAEDCEKAGDFSGAYPIWQKIARTNPEFRDAATRTQTELDAHISFAPGDSGAAEEIFEKLRGNSLKVWFDAGRTTVNSAILSGCRHIVVCLSDEYLSQKQKLPLDPDKSIPVVVRRPLQQDVAPKLRIQPWIDLTKAAEQSSEYQRLVDAVSSRRAEPPFARPSEVLALQRLTNAAQARASMTKHARAVYAYLFEKMVGGAAPAESAAIATRLRASDLPPDVLAHVDTIERYAPLIERGGAAQASIGPALQALYHVVEWTARTYEVHAKDLAQDPLETVWRHIARDWSDKGARLPHSKWELTEGCRHPVPPGAIYPGRNAEDGSGGDLFLLAESKQAADESNSCRSQAASPLVISDSEPFEAGEAGEWRFLALARPRGCTLADLRERFQPLPESVGLAAGRQIAAAFAGMHLENPWLAGSFFRYSNVVLDTQGVVRLVWNWESPDPGSAAGWSGLRSSLYAGLDGIVAKAALSKLASALSPERGVECLTLDTAPLAKDSTVLETAVECWFEKKPLPPWIKDPPIVAPPPPPPPRTALSVLFQLPLECQGAWPLDDKYVVVWMPDHFLSIMDADGKTVWRDQTAVRVRRVVSSGTALAIGGWKGELRWFAAGHPCLANSDWTIGDIVRHGDHWIAGSWKHRLDFLEDGKPQAVLPEPENGVCRLAVSKTDQWAVLSMRGILSFYGVRSPASGGPPPAPVPRPAVEQERKGIPEHIPGALDMAFADGRLVVLTDRGLVTAGPGQRAGPPERLPARGNLRLLSWPEDEACLLVNETGESWIVDRTGTYPRGPRLPAGTMSAADRFRRCVARLDAGGYAYWRGEAKVQSWTEAVSAWISSDGRRVVVVLADRVEVYEEDPA